MDTKITTQEYEQRMIQRKIVKMRKSIDFSPYHGMFMLIGSAQGLLCVAASEQELRNQIREKNFLIPTENLDRQQITTSFQFFSTKIQGMGQSYDA